METKVPDEKECNKLNAVIEEILGFLEKSDFDYDEAQFVLERTLDIFQYDVHDLMRKTKYKR